ncbi:ABC transporter ATP-binding protein [Zwartia vadi]|uniref:ABC transporter ATP-binding protein n=1 Tax=Zwartia vadi TaxID=3058168 RepID=UPI0025B47654|nr:ABC transporter ATP-binding protein [Zwartia vadi]MDN3988222.1 ABC transporter ATP-binding protein [Zwartia vadi]
MGAIVVDHVGKAYKQYPSRWGRLAEWVFPFFKSKHQLHWILKDISFKINSGEAVGIVGINGAGKSTLLKMITGTTTPTTGHVHTSGRVAAMLELGMGFHADFTGRQNAYMSGQLLGYSVEEITQLMPKIEAFAEIGEYMDQQVRVYSSGMQMRLAFSVATAHRPDILIVDEALSVGDAYFQHKSFERIREFRREGTTLLIVSHDRGAIQGICDRAILLDAGRLAMEGDPESVMDYYNALLAKRENKTVRQEVNAQGKIQTTSGSGEASVYKIALLNNVEEPIEVVGVGQQVTLRVEIQVNDALPELVLGYLIKDRLGQSIFGTNTHFLKQPLTQVEAGQKFIYHFSFPMMLGEGTYSIATALHTTDTHISKNYEWRDLALIFNVVNIEQSRFVGVTWLPPKVELLNE